MQSVHEILAGLTHEDYPELTSFMRQVWRRSGSAKVIVLDQAARNRALTIRREREMQRSIAGQFQFDTAC